MARFVRVDRSDVGEGGDDTGQDARVARRRGGDGAGGGGGRRGAAHGPGGRRGGPDAARRRARPLRAAAETVRPPDMSPGTYKGAARAWAASRVRRAVVACPARALACGWPRLLRSAFIEADDPTRTTIDDARPESEGSATTMKTPEMQKPMKAI